MHMDWSSGIKIFFGQSANPPQQTLSSTWKPLSRALSASFPEAPKP